MALIIVVVLIVLLIVYVVAVYNSLVADRNKVKNAWSQIDVELQRRFDLIPNLVESVKGYMEHEEKILSEVADLRSSWASATTVAEKSTLNNQLTESLKSLMAIAENYPDLQANQDFLELQNELENTENKISYSRRDYNDTVTRFNIKLEAFPSNLVASAFKFEKEELFEVKDDSVRKNVKVSF